MKLSNF